MLAFCRVSSPKIASFVRVISAFDVFECLLVMLSTSVHASFIVSHDLISCQLSLREIVHDSGLSSFRDAITSSQNSSWSLPMFTVTPQKIFTSYWFTMILGAFFVTLSAIYALLLFQASSLTSMARVHSSEIVVHDAIGFQLMDNDTLQDFVLLSLRDATIRFQIYSELPLVLTSFHHVMSTIA